MNFLSVSCKVLERFFNKPGRNLKLTLARELDRCAETSGSDQPGLRQGATRTVYGVVRHHILLEHLIAPLVDRKWRKIQSPVRVRLEIGAYLLLFSGSYPDYAVVNEVVEETHGKARGLVNAVLRKIIKKKKNLLNSASHMTDLSIRFSLNPYLVEALGHISSDPPHDLDYLNREPLFHLRINNAVFSYDQARAYLLEKKIQFKELPAFDSFEIKEAGALLSDMESGNRFYFQNTASQFIAVVAARCAQKGILDCCAAPGTKAITISLLKPGISVFANDIDQNRARMIQHFASRFGLAAVQSIVSDISHPSFRLNDTVDLILIDAPCTSSGTLRKNPDLKIKTNAERVNRNSSAQKEILAALLDLKPQPGTFILYSVCSFIEEEADAVIASIWEGNEYTAVDLVPLLDEYRFKYKAGTYGVYLLPDDDLNNDLFYISLFRA